MNADEVPVPSETAAARPAPPANVGAAVAARLLETIGTRVLGQEGVVRQTLIGLLAGGHVLLEGKPGLGKTQLVLCLAGAFGGRFARIQFTPDLMPSDVTGHSLFDMNAQKFVTRRGPVFTQAALLEVMQGRQGTLDGVSTPLEPPFMVLATQNPIEQEGTYPLPEAQLDRFLMKILIDYPEPESEIEIIHRVAAMRSANELEVDLKAAIDREDVLSAQQATAEVTCDRSVIEYALQLIQATRESPALTVGAGTRGAIALIRCAKAGALMAGRDFVVPDDVKAVALPVLRHRVILSPEMTISGQRTDDVLEALVEATPTPRQ